MPSTATAISPRPSATVWALPSKRARRCDWRATTAMTRAIGTKAAPASTGEKPREFWSQRALKK
ncbi:hypothetical protein GCM10020219_009620 [Nonomuraea dietziae]